MCTYTLRHLLWSGTVEPYQDGGGIDAPAKWWACGCAERLAQPVGEIADGAEGLGHGRVADRKSVV